jgi:hypothetical protein
MSTSKGFKYVKFAWYNHRCTHHHPICNCWQNNVPRKICWYDYDLCANFTCLAVVLYYLLSSNRKLNLQFASPLCFPSKIWPQHKFHTLWKLLPHEICGLYITIRWSPNWYYSWKWNVKVGWSCSAHIKFNEKSVN